jgi:hypothetical protein
MVRIMLRSGWWTEPGLRLGNMSRCGQGVQPKKLQSSIAMKSENAKEKEKASGRDRELHGRLPRLKVPAKISRVRIPVMLIEA